MRNMQTSFHQWALSTAAMSMRFLLAVIVSYVLASSLQSILTLNTLRLAGAELPFSLWLQTWRHDIYGLAFGGKYVSYAALIFVGLLVAFPAAALVNRYLGRYLDLSRRWIFFLAGACALGVILLAARAQFYDLVLFSGTRGWVGFCSQVLAGGIGGFFYATLTRQSVGCQRGSN